MVRIVLNAIEGRGEHTRRLSSVKRTATPASTLPTVREISIVLAGCEEGFEGNVGCLGFEVIRDGALLHREENLMSWRRELVVMNSS